MAELKQLSLKELIPGQKYIVKAGFSRKQYKYIGDNIFEDNSGKRNKLEKINYATNIFECNWEQDELIHNLMIVIGDFHIKYIENNKSYTRLSEIIKDGSVLMNKISYKDNKLCLKGDKKVIIDLTDEFYNMIDDLSKRSISYVSFPWCFYRAGRFDKLNIGDILEMPLPFSVTSYFKVSYNWLDKDTNCCLFKILVPGNTSFAILEPFYSSNQKYKAGYEGEITLPSGILKVRDVEKLGLLEMEVWFFTCDFLPYSKEEAIQKLEHMPKC